MERKSSTSKQNQIEFSNLSRSDGDTGSAYAENLIEQTIHRNLLTKRERDDEQK